MLKGNEMDKRCDMEPARQVFESISEFEGGHKWEDMCEAYQNALQASVRKVILQSVDGARACDRHTMARLDEKLAAAITNSTSVKATAEGVGGVLMEFFTAFNLSNTLMAMMNAALKSKVTTDPSSPKFPFPRD